MYSMLTPMVMEAASLAIGAPAPRDTSTREDWRRAHKFPTATKEGTEMQLLPGESYFLPRQEWTPFEKDGKTLLSDTTTLRGRLANGKYDDYIVRDARGQIIASTEDFTSRMVLNLDRPRMGVRLGDKGIQFGQGSTVENLRTGAVDKEGFMPYRAGSEFTVDINAHSSGYGLSVDHSDTKHKLNVNVRSGGPGDIEFSGKAANANVKIRQDKPSELKEVHHRVQVPSVLAKSVNIEDCDSGVGHSRTVTFGWDPADNAHLPKLTVDTSTYRNWDDGDKYSVDFIVSDQVRYRSTTPNKTSYVFSDQPALAQRDFGMKLEAAAEAVSKEADKLRKEFAARDKENAEILPMPNITPAKPKGGGMEK